MHSLGGHLLLNLLFLFYSWTVITISNSDTANKGKFPHNRWLFCWLRGFFFPNWNISGLQHSAYSCCSPTNEGNEDLYLGNGFLCLCCRLARSIQPTCYLVLVWTMATFGASTKSACHSPIFALELCMRTPRGKKACNMKPRIWKEKQWICPQVSIIFEVVPPQLEKNKKKTKNAQLLFHIIKNKSISGCQISFSAPFLLPDKHAVLKKKMQWKTVMDSTVKPLQ